MAQQRLGVHGPAEAQSPWLTEAASYLFGWQAHLLQLSTPLWAAELWTSPKLNGYYNRDLMSACQDHWASGLDFSSEHWGITEVILWAGTCPTEWQECCLLGSPGREGPCWVAFCLHGWLWVPHRWAPFWSVCRISAALKAPAEFLQAVWIESFPFKSMSV